MLYRLSRKENMNLYYKQNIPCPSLSKEEEQELIRIVKYSNNKQEKDKAYNRLLLSQLPYIKTIIGKFVTYLWTPEFEDDLFSVANITLYDSIMKFDETKGYRLITYSGRCIEKQIVKEIETKDHHVRIPQYIYSSKTLIDNACKELAEILNREPEKVEIKEATGLSIKQIDNTLDAFNNNTVLSLDKLKDEETRKSKSIGSENDRSNEIIDKISMENVCKIIKTCITDFQYDILMNYLETNSYIKVGKMMNIPAGSVPNELKKIMRRLRKNENFLKIAKEISSE